MGSLTDQAEITRHRVTLRFLAAPNDVSASTGSVPAGSILEWMDRAGYACAARWSGGYCVTAFMGDIKFTSKIFPGELVEVEASLIYTGRTSMHIFISVSAAPPEGPPSKPAASGLAVFVAKGEAGKPTPVKKWEPQSIQELDRAEAAETRIGARSSIRKRMLDAGWLVDRDRGPRLTLLSTTADVNWGGAVHGGTMMRWMVEGAYTCGSRWAGKGVIAVYSGGFTFFGPVEVGHLVTTAARLILTTRRSLHIFVRLSAASPASPESSQLRVQCVIVLVKLDSSGKPVDVPPFVPESSEDQEAEKLAKELMELRAGMVRL